MQPTVEHQKFLDTYKRVEITITNGDKTINVALEPSTAWQSYARQTFFETLNKTIMELADA